MPTVNRLWPDPAPLDDDGLFQAYELTREGPWLRVNFVSSLDGAVESDGFSRGLSTAVDQRVFALLRAHADAVMVGAGTLRHEGYGPARTGPDLLARRKAAGLAEHPTLVIVSAALDLDPSRRVFTEAPVRPIVIAHADAPDDRREALTSVADVITCSGSVVDLAVAQTELARRGLAQVLCEGGPHLFGSLVAADLVDELCLTVSPLLTGAGAGRIVAGAGRAEPLPMRLGHLLESDGTLLTRYTRSSPS
jgi:riboflavin biosynthesis pyrimidine reductase